MVISFKKKHIEFIRNGGIFIKILPSVYENEPNDLIIDETEYYECFSNC